MQIAVNSIDTFLGAETRIEQRYELTEVMIVEEAQKHLLRQCHVCESLFATLECELIDHECILTHEETRMAIFEFIEVWYNPHRRHSALDYHSPITYETKHEAELAAPSC